MFFNQNGIAMTSQALIFANFRKNQGSGYVRIFIFLL